MRKFLFAIAIGVSLSTIAQSNPQSLIKPYRFSTCRSPDVSLTKFNAPGIDFLQLLNEQTNLALGETTEEALVGRLICVAEAYSAGNKAVVPTAKGNLPTVSELLINKARVLALNMIVTEGKAASAETARLTSDMMLETFNLAKVHVVQGQSSFAESGIQFAQILLQTEKQSNEENVKKLILIFAAGSLLSDLEVDRFGPTFGLDIMNLRKIVNSAGQHSSVTPLEVEVELNIKHAAETLRGLR